MRSGFCSEDGDSKGFGFGAHLPREREKCCQEAAVITGSRTQRVDGSGRPRYLDTVTGNSII